MPHPPPHLILGIESSCDETAAAVVRVEGDGRRDETLSMPPTSSSTSALPGTHASTTFTPIVLSNIIASQHELHAEYRGVVPEIASRAHAERIDAVVHAALTNAGITAQQLTAVAVGNRPGLIGSLLVGVAAAKALAWSLGVPVVGVDHVHAHLFAGFLSDATDGTDTTHGTHSSDSSYSSLATNRSTNAISTAFPALGLVVSGGHTALYRLNSPTDLTRLGSTRDDAVGEAYDKVAAILNLPYPGGPTVDRLAQTGDPHRFTLPTSRLEVDSLDFSFSGLKTAALYLVRGVPEQPRRDNKPPRDRREPIPLTDANIADISAAFQDAAIGALILKLERAIAAHSDCRTILVGGGVSANSLLRARLTELTAQHRLSLRIPAMPFCLDNAAMIAGLGSWMLAQSNNIGDALSMPAYPSGKVTA